MTPIAHGLAQQGEGRRSAQHDTQYGFLAGVGSRQMRHWLEQLSREAGSGIVRADAPEDACLLVAHCDEVFRASFARAPSWTGGANHFVW